MGAPTQWIKIMITTVSAVICHTNQPDLYLELNLWWEQEVNPLTEQNLTERVPLLIGLSEVDKMYFVYYIGALLCGCKCYLVGNKEYGMFNNLKQLRHVNSGIIFLCFGNSKSCLHNTQLKSDWLFNTQLIGSYCKIMRRQLWTLTCPKAHLEQVCDKREWKTDGHKTELHTIYSEWHVSWILSGLNYSFAGKCLIITGLQKRKSFFIYTTMETFK